MSDGDDRPQSPFGGSRRRTNGSSGVRAGGTRFDEVSEPVDLLAVQADDELIDALAAGVRMSPPGARGYDADDHVAAILAAWKAEVDAEPVPELVDLDSAVALVRAARKPASRRPRHLAPVAAAAAFVVLALGGVSVGSASAQPDSLLWPVSKVLFSERAASVEAADSAAQHIAAAKVALAHGNPDAAVQQLQQAKTDLGQVRPQEGKAQLDDVQSFLIAKADETPQGVATDPGKPLKTDRERKVPRGAALTQDPRPDPTDPAPATPTATSAPSPTGPGTSSGEAPSTQPSTSPTAAPTSAPPSGTAEGKPDPTHATTHGTTHGTTSGTTSGSGTTLPSTTASATARTTR